MILRNGLVDRGGGEFVRADVVVTDGWIDFVGSAADGSGADEVIDCTPFAVTPGIVDAHYHSNDNFDRGRWDNLPLEPYMLFSYPSLAAPPVDAVGDPQARTAEAAEVGWPSGPVVSRTA